MRRQLVVIASLLLLLPCMMGATISITSAVYVPLGKISMVGSSDSNPNNETVHYREARAHNGSIGQTITAVAVGDWSGQVTNCQPGSWNCSGRIYFTPNGGMITFAGSSVIEITVPAP